MRDQRFAVPEPDRITIPTRVRVILGSVGTSVGINASNVIDHLVHEPGLSWRDDVLLKKRFGEPAWRSWGTAITDRVVLTTGLGKVLSFGVDHLLSRRCQFGRSRPRIRRKIWIEFQTTLGPSVGPGPV